MVLLSVAKKWSVRPANTDEIDRWNEHIVHNPDGGNILQMREFAKLKSIKRWTPRYLVCQRQSLSVYILVLERHIPLLGNIWYVPKGPGVTNMDDLQTLALALKEYAKRERRVFLVKLEPEVVKEIKR